LQKPQPAAFAHSPHAAYAAQGSCAWQALVTQRQSPHVPLDGPPETPVRQLSSSAHQPHAAVVVQASHAAAAAHGSVPPPQVLALHTQSVQAPAVGPLPVPVRHE
jgi:hypothetical protein